MGLNWFHEKLSTFHKTRCHAVWKDLEIQKTCRVCERLKRIDEVVNGNGTNNNKGWQKKAWCVWRRYRFMHYLIGSVDYQLITWFKKINLRKSTDCHENSNQEIWNLHDNAMHRCLITWRQEGGKDGRI